MTSEVPSDPRNPVLEGPEVALAFGDWFATSTPEETQAFVAANGQRIQKLRARDELRCSETPRTWQGTTDPWAIRSPGGPSSQT